MRYEPWVSVISSGRPASVGPMTYLLDGLPTPHWYVPADQAAAYAAYGATQVHGCRPGLPAARNAALEDAFAVTRPCLQVDDDLRQVRVLEHVADLKPKVATVAHAVDVMTEALAASNAFLAGCADADNTYFYRRGITRDGYVPPGLMLVAPSEPRFDPAIEVRVGYGFTAAHLALYGEALRLDRISPIFIHPRTGGLRAYSRPSMYDDAVAALTRTWPGVFTEHPRRPGDLFMAWDNVNNPRGQRKRRGGRRA